jgi:hypothetical protein
MQSITNADVEYRNLKTTPVKRLCGEIVKAVFAATRKPPSCKTVPPEGLRERNCQDAGRQPCLKIFKKYRHNGDFK